MLPIIVIVAFVIVTLGVLAVTRGWGSVVAGILVGAFLCGVVAFGVGVALGPGPETGGMYGINQLASGAIWGSWGLLIGTIVGGLSGWVLKRTTSP